MKATGLERMSLKKPTQGTNLEDKEDIDVFDSTYPEEAFTENISNDIPIAIFAFQVLQGNETDANATSLVETSRAPTPLHDQDRLPEETNPLEHKDVYRKYFVAMQFLRVVWRNLLLLLHVLRLVLHLVSPQAFLMSWRMKMRMRLKR